jgi:AGCS family alanine or glycine:cation symporter
MIATMTWGVRRGLFSNEAGQGSAPIAHAAAKTDEPVSEGVVALLEPFIDTIVICSLTGLLLIITGVWSEKHPTTLAMTGGDSSYVVHEVDGTITQDADAPAEIRVADGIPETAPGQARFAWHEVAVDAFFTDEEQTQRFTGVIRPADGVAVGADGTEYQELFGDAVESGAPLTSLAFARGFGFTNAIAGDYIVIMSVLLFALSTAISWSYYGDRCANYLFGPKAIIPYRMVYVTMHFIGATVSLGVIWDLGDIFLGIVILPNLLALLLLSPKVVAITRSYFERQPWIENREVHQRIVEERRYRR